MRVPVRPLRGRWPAWFERRATRFVWSDPRVVLDDDASPDAFRAAMDALEVGDTVKITAADRHPGADALLIDNVDLATATIVDIGASDGTTSVDLVSKLPAFKSYVIADLFLTLDVVTDGRRDFFFDHAGTCVLVCGPRWVAWPTRSRAVHARYTRLIDRAVRRGRNRRTALLLNPRTRALLARDSRVSYAVHDVFTPWPAPAPDVIKVANVLGPYFGPDDISRALHALYRSLDEGGHLLLVDNGRITGAEPRAGLYQRSGDHFRRVAGTATLPQLDPLVQQVRADGSLNRP